MTTKPAKILFISHDATRTGAPIVLLHLLRWLRANKNFEVTILLKNTGELEPEFKKIATTYTLLNKTPSSKSLVVRGLKKITKKIVPHTQPQKYILPDQLKNSHFDLVYLNTVDSLDLAPILKQQFKCPVIGHIHENDFTINYYYPNSLSPENISAIDHFIAVSKSTEANLVANHPIPQNKISLVYECIDTLQVKKPNYDRVQSIKQELSLTDEFIVGGSGLTSWRKGVDLFVQLAAILNRLRPGNNIRLLWVGSISREFKYNFLYENTRLDIKDKIIFTGSKSNPEDYFHLFSVFSLTSREDPFPLVALEAAAQAKPIICFENSGGIPELISEGGGILVPYGDIQAMAEQILYLHDNSGIKEALGREIEKQIQKFDVNVVGEQIVQAIDQLVSNKYA